MLLINIYQTGQDKFKCTLSKSKAINATEDKLIKKPWYAITNLYNLSYLN